MAKREALTVERIRRFICPMNKTQAFLWDDIVKRLAVRVTSSGVKSFVYEGKLNRETIRWTIGKTFDWTIEDARKEARRLQTLIDRGIDPREQAQAKKAEKAAKKAAIEATEKYTLKALLKEYADHLEARGKVKSAKAARSVVKVHVLESDPTLSAKPATSVTSHDVVALIRQAREAGKERTAGILRSTISAAYNCGRKAPFDSGISSSFIKFNIVNNPVDVIPTIPVKAGSRTLNRDELKKYIEALGNDTVDMALKLALHSGGQRMAEILRAGVADWDETNKTLRLFDPKGKRTQAREHLLPLGPIAAGIVSELVSRAKTAETSLLFPSAKKTTSIHDSMPGPRVTEISKQIETEAFDLRDIRRTCETMLAGLGISRDIRAQLLSHGISGVQAVHYDKHDYLKEKHTALMRWEKHLQRIISGEDEKNVIEFREVKG